jgi:hypothetical protein
LWYFVVIDVNPLYTPFFCNTEETERYGHDVDNGPPGRHYCPPELEIKAH